MRDRLINRIWIAGKVALPLWLAALLSLIITLITFPSLNPVFANGIDPPLAWVFNSLIRGHLLQGKDIIFPHGPLAFIMYPLPMGWNLELAILMHFLIRTGFAFVLVRLPGKENPGKIILAIVASLLLLSLLDILLVLIGLVILCYLHYFRSHRIAWTLPALFLTVSALYIKAFVGIVCSLVTLSFFLLLLYAVFKKEEKRNRILLLLIPPCFLMIGWILMYGNLKGLSRYVYGMFQLAGDNSSAVAYYPDNNWFYISGAIGLMLLLVGLHLKKAAVNRFFILLGPALFAVWKYGMAREDYLHAEMYFLFVLLLAFLFLLILEKRKPVSAAAVLTIVILNYLNLQNAYYFEPLKFNFSGFRYSAGSLINYRQVADTSNVASERNIRRNVLDKSVRQLIGNGSVDIYPWDYSYIPANNLNWLPRPVLQSYACYTPWLDGENAAHFSSSGSPEFIIWELRKITHDIHNGTLESIDGRYLLNDQPETALAILSHYRLLARQGGVFPVLLFRKRELPVEVEKTMKAPFIAGWNHWINVDSTSADILRAEVKFSRNFLGMLNSFLYKDEAFYTYYLLDNGEIRLYRIVPRNAAQGLWINPLLMNPENSLSEPRVKKIMFRCTNPGMMKDQISVSWESVTFPDAEKHKAGLDAGLSFAGNSFGKTNPQRESRLLNTLNDLEGSYNGWSENPGPDRTVPAHSGSTSCLVPPGGFSGSFECSLDSVCQNHPGEPIIIKSMCWVNAAGRIDANYVISVEKDGRSLSWKAVKINDFVIQKNSWNYVFNFLVPDPELLEQKGLRLKIYAWNLGKVSFRVDDLRLCIDSWSGSEAAVLQ